MHWHMSFVLSCLTPGQSWEPCEFPTALSPEDPARLVVTHPDHADVLKVA